MMHNFEEISMWKKIIICSFIIAIILIFICIKISIPDNSDNIIIGVQRQIRHMKLFLMYMTGMMN